MSLYIEVFCVFLAAVLAYYFGQASKFNENRFDLIFEKYKKYDALRNSYYVIFSIMANPEFESGWNQRHLPLIEAHKQAMNNIRMKRDEAGIFISQPMEILTRYLDVKALSYLVDKETNYIKTITEPIEGLIDEFEEKLFLMEELIQHECKTESLNNTLTKNFFEADISQTFVREKGLRWFESKKKDFDQMNVFFENYNSPFYMEVGSRRRKGNARKNK